MSNRTHAQPNIAMAAMKRRVARWIRLYLADRSYSLVVWTPAEDPHWPAVLRRIQRLSRIGYRLDLLITPPSKPAAGKREKASLKQCLPSVKKLQQPIASASVNKRTSLAHAHLHISALSHIAALWRGSYLPNVKLTGASRLAGEASSDRRERR